jgi:Icc-related predicted phosphoesterase
MKIAAVSDFHGDVWNAHVPNDIDLLLIAGDIGHTDDLEVWLPMTGLPPNRIIGIAGNHDWVAIKKQHVLKQLPWTYLQDSFHEVDGLLIYGTPWTPPFMDWAFMLPEEELKKKWEMIPEQTNILLTHGPPRGCGDMPVRTYGQENGTGSTSLTTRCEQLRQLKLHVFGHIHEERGKQGIYKYGGLWSNVSLLDEHYKPWDLPMAVFDL